MNNQALGVDGVRRLMEQFLMRLKQANIQPVTVETDPQELQKPEATPAAQVNNFDDLLKGMSAIMVQSNQNMSNMFAGKMDALVANQQDTLKSIVGQERQVKTGSERKRVALMTPERGAGRDDLFAFGQSPGDASTTASSAFSASPIPSLFGSSPLSVSGASGSGNPVLPQDIGAGTSTAAARPRRSPARSALQPAGLRLRMKQKGPAKKSLEGQLDGYDTDATIGYSDDENSGIAPAGAPAGAAGAPGVAACGLDVGALRQARDNTNQRKLVTLRELPNMIEEVGKRIPRSSKGTPLVADAPLQNAPPIFVGKHALNEEADHYTSLTGSGLEQWALPLSLEAIEAAGDEVESTIAFWNQHDQPGTKFDYALKSFGVRWAEGRYRRVPMIIAMALTVAYHRHFKPEAFHHGLPPTE